MHVIIGRKRYRIVYARLAKYDGKCEHPAQVGKQITIDPRVRKDDRLHMETVLHEVLHAAVWSLDEECVGMYAKDVARILHRLGFRRTEDGSNGKT